MVRAPCYLQGDSLLEMLRFLGASSLFLLVKNSLFCKGDVLFGSSENADELN